METSARELVNIEETFARMCSLSLLGDLGARHANHVGSNSDRATRSRVAETRSQHRTTEHDQRLAYTTSRTTERKTHA